MSPGANEAFGLLTKELIRIAVMAAFVTVAPIILASIAREMFGMPEIGSLRPHAVGPFPYERCSVDGTI